MMLEKTLTRIKNEIKDYFKSLNPIDRPGVAIIFDEENSVNANCIDTLNSDCEDVKFNWFLTKINSTTDENFLFRMIDDYIEMEDVTVLIMLLPLPEKFNKIESKLLEMRKNEKYEKLHTMQVIGGYLSIGARITALGIIKEYYVTNKGW